MGRSLLIGHLACALLLIGATCAGRSSVATDNLPGQVGATHYDSAGQALAEVLTSLPADCWRPGEQVGVPGVLTPVSRDRTTGATGLHTIALRGIDRFSAGGAVSDVTDASRLESGLPGAGQLSYAVYRFALHGMIASTLTVDVELYPRADESPSTYFLGLADYAAGRWRWQGPLDADATPQMDEPDLSSMCGNLFVALAAYDGASLDCLSLEVGVYGLAVGPGRDYDTIEAAYADAQAVDAILVYPREDNAPYESPALLVEKESIAFIGVGAPAGERVRLSGEGFNYSGVGSTPRAIFQFNPGSSGGLLAGFELYEAHNDSYNGAGVRVNQANGITVRNCEIHDCDMGMMSNGNGTQEVSENQVVEYCEVHHNGNWEHPGYNHNFYLGGTSVTLRGCEVYQCLTGHNVKSRAHFNRIEYCYIHHSANRELDLVDAAGDTDAAGSHSVLIGNLIVKDPEVAGNHQVVHFGQDGGNDHIGDVWLIHNTIVTPFISPIVRLSAPSAGAVYYNNIIWDEASGQLGQQLVETGGGAQLGSVSGGYNWLAQVQNIPAGTAIDDGANYRADAGEDPPFVDALNSEPALRDYRLLTADLHIVDAGLTLASLTIPTGPGQSAVAGVPYQFYAPHYLQRRYDAGLPDLGAYGWQ